MHFGENQLSPGLIGLSPLPTVHPSFLQQTPVRASTKSYLRFTLTMGRSPGFGSTDCNSFALLRLGFPTAPCLKHLTSLQPVTRRLINQKAHRHRIAPAPIACRHTVSGSLSLPSPGFFSPFPHGTCPLSVIREYLALESGLPSFPQGSTCLVVLRIPIGPHAVSHTGLSPSMAALSRAFCYITRSHIWVLQPRP
jgi:hypothetical protein